MQKKITHLFFILAILSCFVYLPQVQAVENEGKTELKKESATLRVSSEPSPPLEENLDENSSEALEMIALRMKSLSSSLNGMPKIPQLNETIHLPLQGAEENLPQDSEEDDPEISQKKS